MTDLQPALPCPVRFSLQYWYAAARCHWTISAPQAAMQALPSKASEGKQDTDPVCMLHILSPMRA